MLNALNYAGLCPLVQEGLRCYKGLHVHSIFPLTRDVSLQKIHEVSHRSQIGMTDVQGGHKTSISTSL